MKVCDAIAGYLQYIATEHRLAKATQVVYRAELARFEQFLATADVTEVEQITANMPRLWQAQRMEEGLTPRSILRMLSSLRGWCKYLRRKGLVKADFMVKVVPPRCPKPLPVFFQVDEAAHIYDDSRYPDTFDGHTDRLLLRLLYETGMRRSEAAGLMIGSVDFEGRTLKVMGKRSKERYIPLADEMLQAIKEYFDERNNVQCNDSHLLVTGKGKALTSGMIYIRVKRYMRPLSKAQRASPHIFRHSFATHILNNGGSIEAVKELLGHASLDATQIYTHVTREHLKETYNQAHPRATKK